jgi:hypothetical protein
MSKRKTTCDALSFYDCLLLIKEEREHPDEKLTTRPRNRYDLNEHEKKIQAIRNDIQEVVMNNYDDDKFEDMVDALVKSWNITNLKASYPTVSEDVLKELLTIDTILVYNSRTDNNWYQVSEIEITATVKALNINLLIWNTIEHTYHNYSNIANKDWCVLTKHGLHFELMYIPEKDNEELHRFRFNNDFMSDEMKGIFQLEE